PSVRGQRRRGRREPRSPGSRARSWRSCAPGTRTPPRSAAHVSPALLPRAAVRAEPALPEVFLLAHVLADPAAEDEERVAQPVDVTQRPLVDRLDARELQDLALRAAADGARLVEERVDSAAAGERERLERLEVLLAVVHEALERRDLRLAHLEHPLVLRLRRRGELAAEVEQLVLDSPQHLVEPAVVLALGQTLRVERADEADDRVQLVDRPVGDDPRRVLGHALAAHQPGLAVVAEARVDARDADRHG